MVRLNCPFCCVCSQLVWKGPPLLQYKTALKYRKRDPPLVPFRTFLWGCWVASSSRSRWHFMNIAVRDACFFFMVNLHCANSLTGSERVGGRKGEKAASCSCLTWLEQNLQSCTMKDQIINIPGIGAHTAFLASTLFHQWSTKAPPGCLGHKQMAVFK